MTTAMPAPTAPSPFDKPAKLLWTDLPLAVGRISPNLGRALNERAGWLERVPPVLVLIVPAAFLLGAMLGAFHWGNPAAYSSSWQIVSLLLAIACACGAGVGLWLTVGYAVGDFLVYGHPRHLVDTPVNLIGLRVGLLVSYIGLFLLLVLVPMTANAVRKSAMAKIDNGAIAIAVQAGVAGVFAFAWAQSVPLMLRPMWVWAPHPELVKVPPIAAIEPVQSNGLMFGIVAAIATLGMAALPNPRADRWSPPSPILAKTGKAQGFIRAFVSGVLFTLMFSGLAGSVLDFVVLYVLVQTAALLRLAILPLFPKYMHEVQRVPLIIRAVVPMIIGLVAGFALISYVFADNDLRVVQLSFMPVILSLGIGLIATAFTIPTPAPGPAVRT